MTSARILIVEDEGITARDIGARLTHLGYQVVGIAGSGTDAIAKAAATQPDLVLMDIRLRGALDGVQAARQLHDRFRIPVTYLTAYADDETLARAQDTAYGYLVKPFDERELHATIQTALYRGHLEKQIVRAQAQLKESEARLRLLTDQVPAVLWTTDRDLRFTSGRGAALQALGVDPDQLVGVSVWDYFQTRDPSFPAIAAHRNALDGEPGEYEVEWAGRTFQSHVEPLQDPRGAVIGVIGVAVDITARKLAEGALRESNRRLQEALSELRAVQHRIVQQERLNALGTMASGIVHDFSNLLSPITGLSELLLMDPSRPPDEEKTRHYLETIYAAARDAATIVGRLREFYRRRNDAEPLIPVALDEVVGQVLSFTRPRWRAQQLARGTRIDVVTKLHPTPPVAGREAELRETLTNLVLNAADAMPQGGTMTVRTRMHDPVDGSGGPNLDPSRAYVVLEVEDSGVGMNEEIRQQCFEPFFSTKGARGTGMGLASVYGIVQRHRGSIEVHSEVGCGTTFRIYLPASETPADLAPELSNNPGRPLHILLVDDEPVVRETVAAYLLHEGHTVETASDGRDGWSKFCAGRFDLVITDSAMPAMRGAELATAIKASSPQTPIIGLTGFGEMMEAEGEPTGSVDCVVSKPVTLALLRNAIGHVLGARQ